MAKSLILLTGATGHLGFRTLLFALQAGYRVRATIRKANQEQRIRDSGSIQPFNNDLSFVVVEDITTSDAYSKAIKDVEYVLHIASPIASNSNNQGDTWETLFYDPAIKGTTSLLDAAKDTASIKRVVITSSVVVLESLNRQPPAGPYDLREVPDSATAAKVGSRMEAYSLSKVLAHAAGTDFVRKHKVSFDLVRIIPGFIQGANELNATATDVCNGSNRGTMDAALGKVVPGPKLNAQVFLDDVARAHVLSLRPEIGKNGANFIIAGNGGMGISWDEIGRIVEEKFPNEVADGVLTPVKGQQDLVTAFDVRSSEETLGFAFAGADVMVESVVGQYLQMRGDV